MGRGCIGAGHPAIQNLYCQDKVKKPLEVQSAQRVEQTEEPSSDQNDSMTKESLSAINKTLSAFWNRRKASSNHKRRGFKFQRDVV